MKLFSLITICIISLVACVPPGYFSEVNGKTIATNFKEVFISDDYFKLLEFKVKVLPMIIDSQDLIFPDSNSVIYHSRGFRIIADYSLKLNYDSLKINQSLELSNIQILKKSKPMDFETININTDTIFIIPEFKIVNSSERTDTLNGKTTFSHFGSSKRCKTVIVFQNMSTEIFSHWHKT